MLGVRLHCILETFRRPNTHTFNETFIVVVVDLFMGRFMTLGAYKAYGATNIKIKHSRESF